MAFGSDEILLSLQSSSGKWLGWQRVLRWFLWAGGHGLATFFITLYGCKGCGGGEQDVAASCTFTVMVVQQVRREADSFLPLDILAFISFCPVPSASCRVSWTTTPEESECFCQPFLPCCLHRLLLLPELHKLCRRRGNSYRLGDFPVLLAIDDRILSCVWGHVLASSHGRCHGVECPEHELLHSFHLLTSPSIKRKDISASITECLDPQALITR